MFALVINTQRNVGKKYMVFPENREVFKKARLPVHDDCTSDSDDQDITKENKPSKKLVTNVKLQRRSSKHHSDRPTEHKVHE